MESCNKWRDLVYDVSSWESNYGSNQKKYNEDLVLIQTVILNQRGTLHGMATVVGNPKINLKIFKRGGN